MVLVVMRVMAMIMGIKIERINSDSDGDYD